MFSMFFYTLPIFLLLDVRILFLYCKYVLFFILATYLFEKMFLHAKENCAMHSSTNITICITS